MVEVLNARPSPVPEPAEQAPDSNIRTAVIFNGNIGASSNIRHSADALRRNGLIGLRIQDEAIRYDVISDGLETHVEREVTEEVGLPRIMWTGPRWAGGKRKLAWPERKTTTRPVGLPRYKKEGGIQYFERDREELPGLHIYGATVLVMTSDSVTGEPQDIEEYSRAKFYDMADGLAQGDTSKLTASWGPRLEDTAEQSEIPLRPTGHTGQDSPISVFDTLTNQLKANDVTRWTGVAWQEGDATKEVVFDQVLKYRAASGVGHTWVRRVGIKTTRGDEIKLKELNIYDFTKALEAAKGSLRNMRLVKSKTAAEVREAQTRQDRRDAARRRAGRFTVAALTQHDQLRTQELEEYIATHAEHGAESLAEEDDRTAVWLLNYPDIAGAMDDDARLENVSKLVDSPIGKHRIEILNAALMEHGVLALYDLAGRVRHAYLDAIKKLDHPLDTPEHSISKVLEIAADLLPHFPDLLDDTDAGRVLQDKIIDILVGQAVARVATEDDNAQTVKRSLFFMDSDLKLSGKLNDQKQPAYEVVKKLRMNDTYFTWQDSVMPTIRTQIWKQQAALRKPAIDMAEHIYHKRQHGIEPTLHELELFGRAMRSLIAE